MKVSRRALSISLGVFVLGGTAAYAFRRPAGFFLLLHFGRSPGCTWDDASQAIRERPRSEHELTAGFAASSRMLLKDPTCCDLWSTTKGNLWVPPGSDHMVPWLLAHMELEAYQVGPCQLRQGDVVLDCGAHVGLFTKEALAAGARVVVAIEPAPENVECLERNFAEEIRAGRVIIYPKGLWDAEGSLPFRTRPGSSATDSFVPESEAAAGVSRLPVTTLDALVAELALERVDFIKMNIEGAEQRALAGARKTLSRFHPRLAIAADHRPDDQEKIPGLARAAWPGYRQRCGNCFIDRRHLRIVADVLLFY
jgi:FkbM family methyltransferase